MKSEKRRCPVCRCGLILIVFQEEGGVIPRPQIGCSSCKWWEKGASSEQDNWAEYEVRTHAGKLIRVEKGGQTHE